MAVVQRVKFSLPLRYRGNLILLVLCIFFWPPLLLVLLIKNGFVEKEDRILYCSYHGKWGWAIFWGIFFFPIAYILLALKGLDIVEEDKVEEILIKVGR